MTSLMMGVTTPFSADFVITDRGDGWTKFDVRTALQLPNGQMMPAGTSPGVCGSCQFNGIWAGPASLASLQQGQVLDQDKLTGMTTTVTQVSDNSVTISQSNTAGELDSTYDKTTGMRIGGTYISAIPKAKTSFQVIGRE